MNITLNAICLAIFLSIAIVFLLMNMVLGYILSAAFFAGSLYEGYYFYLLLWLHNWERPFSEGKKQKIEQVRKHMRDYQRYNLYNRLYHFADATEVECQAEKAKEELKKTRR